MRPQIQLLDPDVVVDLARRGAREGLQVDLRRRRAAFAAMAASGAGLAWFEAMPSKRRPRREAPVTSRHRAEGINDTVPNRLDHVGSSRPGK